MRSAVSARAATTSGQGCDLDRRARAARKRPTYDALEGFVESRIDVAGEPWGAAAQRALGNVRTVVQSGLYPYQRTLESNSGARVRVRGVEMLMMSSCDYLGLIGNCEIENAAACAIRTHGTGTGGVRLLTGTNALHRRLERRLAAFKAVEAAVVFTSGYLANLAAITAVVGPGDTVVIDSRVHHSIVDACRLARVRTRSFRHNDPSSLERELLTSSPNRGSVLVIVDGLYSMDGDLCPLPQLVELKRKHGALLMVDEAHALGTVGSTGHGVHEHFEIAAADVDVWTGSLSKAIPSVGGYVAGSCALALLVQHAPAPFMFSSALCPSAVAATVAALDVVESEPWRLATMRNNARLLHRLLRDADFEIGPSASAITPVVVGDETRAYRIARHLHEAGVYATPIVYPAVPKGTARLRLCAMASHQPRDLEVAVATLTEAGKAWP